ncbi:MAG: PID-CTERM protein-sorting domain-containing protein [Balneola sp.]
MKTTFILLLALIIVSLATAVVQAQPGLPGAPSQAPIDGGLGLLAAAGGAYALKKLRDKKNREEGLE